MISIINSTGLITICKLESIESDIINHALFINNFEMEKIRDNEIHTSFYIQNYDQKLNKLCEKILILFHTKKRGIYKITPDLDIIELKIWRKH